MKQQMFDQCIYSANVWLVVQDESIQRSCILVYILQCNKHVENVMSSFQMDTHNTESDYKNGKIFLKNGKIDIHVWCLPIQAFFVTTYKFYQLSLYVLLSITYGVDKAMFLKSVFLFFWLQIVVQKKVVLVFITILQQAF